jgi:hypothetical protein
MCTETQAPFKGPIFHLAVWVRWLAPQVEIGEDDSSNDGVQKDASLVGRRMIQGGLSGLASSLLRGAGIALVGGAVSKLKCGTAPPEIINCMHKLTFRYGIIGDIELLLF